MGVRVLYCPAEYEAVWGDSGMPTGLGVAGLS